MAVLILAIYGRHAIGADFFHYLRIHKDFADAVVVNQFVNKFYLYFVGQDLMSDSIVILCNFVVIGMVENVVAAAAVAASDLRSIELQHELSADFGLNLIFDFR